MLTGCHVASSERSRMEHALVWYDSARYHERIGNVDLAIRDYQHAIQFAPHVGAFHNNYGISPSASLRTSVDFVNKFFI